MGRLPFTVPAIAGAIMLIVGVALPALRVTAYPHPHDDPHQGGVIEGSQSFLQDLIGTDSWYRIEGGAVVCGFAIAALVIAAIYAARYHRALVFAVAMFGLAASIAVLGTETLSPYDEEGYTASAGVGAWVSIAGANILFLAPVAEFLKHRDR